VFTYIKMAWRNTWRNWRRTLIATVAIVLSLVLLIFMEAFMDGTDEAIYGNVVRLYGGNVLIHAPGFRERSTRMPLLPLDDPDSVLALVSKQPNVVAASKRIITGGLISNKDSSQAVSITAIDPLIEAPVNLAAANMSFGRFLVPEDRDDIVIGRALADQLNVTVGDRVSLLGRRTDDSMRHRSMTVVGIFDLGLGEAEKALVYMNLPAAQTLYNLRGQETEIAVVLEELGREDELIDSITPALPNYEVDSIFTLRPEFAEAMATDRAMGVVIGGIMLVMAGIGILNLMLMAVYERTREMGVLAALGLKGRQTMGLFLLEGAFIGLTGAAIGCLVSWLLVTAVNRTGIDFSALYEDIGEFGEIYALMGDKLYPAMSAGTILQYGLAAVIMAVLASIIPAFQAARKEPAESLHFV
jgi:ABC-type lipoprotein release transport system permease subunit